MSVPGPSSGAPGLRVGVIGLGWAGQQHIEAYAASPEVRVVAIAGHEEATRTELASRYGIEHALADWQDLLAVDGLDAVSVAVPTVLHAPIALAALERGMHVLCEKPISRTLAEAEAMVAAARGAGRVLDVAFNHRRRGDVQKLRSIVAAGRLGDLYYVKGWWLRRRGIPTLGSWFTRADAAGGGPLLDIGVHVLDFALEILGRPAVRTVSASTYDLLGSSGFGSDPESAKTGVTAERTFDVEDLATAFMRLDGGGTLTLETSWAAHRPEADEFGLTLYGTRGGAELVVRDMAPSGELRLFTDEDGAAAETHVSADAGRRHDAVVDEFLAKIAAGDWAHHDGAEAAGLARVVDACYRSAAQGAEVRLGE